MRIDLYICDRCSKETREENNLREMLFPGTGYRRDLCPECVNKLQAFIVFGSGDGDRAHQVDVLNAAADVVKANAGNLQGRDASIVEGELRTIAAILEDDE